MGQTDLVLLVDVEGYGDWVRGEDAGGNSYYFKSSEIHCIHPNPFVADSFIAIGEGGRRLFGFPATTEGDVRYTLEQFGDAQLRRFRRDVEVDLSTNAWGGPWPGGAPINDPGPYTVYEEPYRIPYIVVGAGVAAASVFTVTYDDQHGVSRTASVNIPPGAGAPTLSLPDRIYAEITHCGTDVAVGVQVDMYTGHDAMYPAWDAFRVNLDPSGGAPDIQFRGQHMTRDTTFRRITVTSPPCYYRAWILRKYAIPTFEHQDQPADTDEAVVGHYLYYR